MSRFSPRTASAILLAALVMAGCGPDPIAAPPPALSNLYTGSATVSAEVTGQIRTRLMEHPDFRLEGIERLDIRQPFADAPQVYSFEGIGIRAHSQPLQHHFLGSWKQGTDYPSLSVMVASQPGLPTQGTVGEDTVSRIAGRLITHPGVMINIEGLDSTALDVSTPLGITAFHSRITVAGQPKLAQGYYAADKTIRMMVNDLR